MSITTIGPNGAETSLLASFPDPHRHPNEMERFRHLAKTGGAHYLVGHFGNSDTTLIDGTVYVSPDSLPSIKGLRARHTDCLRRRSRGLCPAQRLHLRRAGPRLRAGSRIALHRPH